MDDVVINTDAFDEGVYFIKINGETVRKVVIQR